MARVRVVCAFFIGDATGLTGAASIASGPHVRGDLSRTGVIKDTDFGGYVGEATDAP